MEFLQDNGQWLAAAGTLLLAIVALITLLQNRALVKQNRIMQERPRIKEMILSVINPLLEAIGEIKGYHERREYMWTSLDLLVAEELFGADRDITLFQSGANDAFLPLPWIEVEEKAAKFCALNKTVYRDFARTHPSLIGAIQGYDEKAESFGDLLLDLAKAILLSPELEGKVKKSFGRESGSELKERTLSVACITFNRLLEAPLLQNVKHYWEIWEDFGLDSCVGELHNNRNVNEKMERIFKEARSFVEELKAIEADLLQIKNGYLEDYHLTREETEATNKGTPHLV